MDQPILGRRDEPALELFLTGLSFLFHQVRPRIHVHSDEPAAVGKPEFRRGRRFWR